MKDDKEEHVIEKSVEFYANPVYESYYLLSVGEKESFVIINAKEYTGTATLYNTVKEQDPYDPEQYIYIYIYVKGTVFGSAKFINGVATIPFGSLAKGEHVFILNSTCLDYESQIEVNVKENTPGISVSVSPSEINLGEAVVVKITGGPNDSYVSIYVDDDYTNGVYPDLNVNLEYNINNLTAGTHKIRVVIDDADKFYSNSSYVTVKVSTSIASSAVSAVYKDSKYLVATLKDGQGKAIAGAEISTNINGLKTLKTDKNGQVKWSVASLAPKTYNVVLTFAGKDHYLKSTNKVTVKIAKATPKLTAKKKTFKKSIKVKKYSVVLKDNKGKAIKKATVSIKVGKKTFKAKTNSKGKATFKIKKLTKKAKYNAKVTYKGNKYYNKKTKNVKITIK